MATLVNEYTTKHVLSWVDFTEDIWREACHREGSHHTAHSIPPIKLPHLSLRSLSSHLPHSGLISKYSATNLSCYFFRSNFSLPLKLWQQPTSLAPRAQLLAQPLIKVHVKHKQSIHIEEFLSQILQ